MPGRGRRSPFRTERVGHHQCVGGPIAVREPVESDTVSQQNEATCVGQKIARADVAGDHAQQSAFHHQLQPCPEFDQLGRSQRGL